MFAFVKLAFRWKSVSSETRYIDRIDYSLSQIKIDEIHVMEKREKG